MAVENTLSDLLTNRAATPPVLNDARNLHGRVRVAKGTLEVAAADDDTSTYRLCGLPSHASLLSAKVFNDAITGGTGYDLGLYYGAKDGGAAIDDDCYASAVSMATASLVGVELAFEARNIDAINNRVWQDAGLSEDPQKELDLVLTADTVGTAAGTISFVVLYLDGS